ncbi:MAG: UDP-N-acetylglucosamine 1-carboxyvinyltransferase [Burkholderiaceae bacterium]|jgi:UDP-N-acetylglucosamine 1-carboxyvinyltransferase|nr:UDP-N-acetylglucosamine 1-carboxyvinyltransferase [Burkholderiaceae bacterium]
MDKLLIRGGRRLEGDVQISGAKNAALPEMCAALLTDEPVQLLNMPRLHDVRTMRHLLENMGMRAHTQGERGGMSLQAGAAITPVAPYDLVKTMRASVLALGPLLARFGHAQVSLPGGCAIGSRPVDQHIKGLRAMGAQIDIEHGNIVARLPPGRARLKGARITTDMITVTGTENLLMAACLAEGETVLENAAREPEIADLAHMLIGMGARIEGHGGSQIRVQGVERLRGCTHQVLPDRIEAGTFLCAVAAAGGRVTLRQARAGHMQAVVEKLAAAGAIVEPGENAEDCFIRITSRGGPALTAQSFCTKEYPDFPTDMQAQFMALNCIAQGSSTVTEMIFENRFMHVNELVRLGAHVRVDGHSATIHGPARLSGATVMATDLRASAGLVIAGLVAEGETLVDRIYHLDRGYDQMEEKLRGIGADVERV